MFLLLLKLFPKDEKMINGVIAVVNKTIANERPSPSKAKDTFGIDIQFDI
mgnify:CR=1 FL=1